MENQDQNQDVKGLKKEEKSGKKFDFLKIQNDLTKELSDKKKGQTVDDTLERQLRSEQMVKSGKVKASEGKLRFMAMQNAKYLSQGKPQPYSNATLEMLQKKL